MTSYRQFEANRRNALKSTGPKTEAGKQSSRCNAVRHGLTADTVIGALEDAEDYRAFETAITADYDAQSAVERELVLRLASILWRLRRATTMETGLFEIQAQQLHDYRQNRQLLSNCREVIHTAFRRAESASGDAASSLSDSGMLLSAASQSAQFRARSPQPL
jgi:anti-sigma-K factor RskA